MSLCQLFRHDAFAFNARCTDDQWNHLYCPTISKMTSLKFEIFIFCLCCCGGGGG